MKKNDEVVIDITDYTADGSGLGRYDGQAVFVPLTAVGDRVLVKILKVKKTVAFGKVIKIIEKAPDRIADSCSAFSRCGGCVFRHIDYKAELAAKSQRVYNAIKRIGGVDLQPRPILYGRPDRYRNKAQYPVGSDGKAGFFAAHSHRIIPCGDCDLQPEIFGRVIKVFEDWIEKYGISIYNEETHSGLLRHIYIRNAEITGQIMVCAVINGENLPKSEELINLLKQVLGDRLCSFQLNLNTRQSNIILGDSCKTLYGEDYITDVLRGIKVRLSPMSFYQVNRNMAERLYEKAEEYAEIEGKVLLDLYCGAGTIGLSMAKKAKKVIGVEIVPEAIEDAKFNAWQNGIENAEFLCADASQAAKQLRNRGIKPEVVIVDPPRKGCSEDLIHIICEDFAPERVVYVSCDPATLARDIKLFTQLGYGFEEYTPADLFPRTAHCECVALLHSDINS